MQIRNLGGSGLRVSAVGLGCNNFGQRCDLETSRKVIHKAIDLGITLFDTADIYAGMGGSETVLGQVLGDRRKDIVLATKKHGRHQTGRVTALHPVRRGGQPDAAEDRLHRSLPAA
jgi:aryl-alcohol dehydrogenase-like predicted oxidoreductase